LITKGNKQAIRNIRHSLSLKPDENAYNDIGVVYMSKMGFKDAEREFTESLKFNPDNAKVHNNLGTALAPQEKYDEAIRQFEKAPHL
jgi:Tfp pilus assembly protein PilF